MTKTQKFTDFDLYQAWIQEHKEKIMVVGEVRRPYRMKTKTGFKKTDLNEITVYYKELNNE